MSQQQINSDTIIARSDAMFSDDLDNDVVMMDVEKGVYYGLESNAARIWKLIEQPTAVGSICDSLAAEYDISPDECRQEVAEFLEDLLDRKVIHIAG